MEYQYKKHRRKHNGHAEQDLDRMFGYDWEPEGELNAMQMHHDYKSVPKKNFAWVDVADKRQMNETYPKPAKKKSNLNTPLKNQIRFEDTLRKFETSPQ